MSDTNQTNRSHRAQLVAEAVVSAYIHEIAPAHGSRPQPRTRDDWAESHSRVRARVSQAGSAHRSGLVRWRRLAPVAAA